MQKKIRIFAIIATALIGLSVILLVTSLLFQETFAKVVFNYSDEMLSAFPQFPLIPFLTCLLKTGCAALLIICCGNKKGGIWLEIVVIVALANVLPLLNYIGSIFYTSSIGKYGGYEQVAAYSITSSLASFCLIPANLGIVLAYLTCGMSIAFKKMSKAPNKVTVEFPFNEPENTAVFTCNHIIENNAPVLYVSHDKEDGMWQFLCGEAHTIKDGRMISLKEIYDIDNTISKIADMPYGYFAERNDKNSNWQIKKSDSN